jgi:hypothetical protein
MQRLCVGIVLAICVMAEASAPVRKLVIEEQRIEGKIRRPQLVLIKADQRPRFGAIVVQSAQTEDDVTRAVDPAVIEKCPYDEPFRFAGKRIVNIVP